MVGPNLGHRVLADPHPRRHRAGRPVRRPVCGQLPMGYPQHFLDRSRWQTGLTTTTLGDLAPPSRTENASGAPHPNRHHTGARSPRWTHPHTPTTAPACCSGYDNSLNSSDASCLSLRSQRFHRQHWPTNTRQLRCGLHPPNTTPTRRVDQFVGSRHALTPVIGPGSTWLRTERS